MLLFLFTGGLLVSAKAVAMGALSLTAICGAVVAVFQDGHLRTSLGVLVDATVIRGLLVPAFMRLTGPANWWAPRPLARLQQRAGLTEVEAPEHRPHRPPAFPRLLPADDQAHR
ncbi:hypothetical protein ACGFNU_37980 [Spirillospora sp. NPDC048911]|uniref:hypothetical protein n=1 Tax=Spirillospora sp. NPDC048911 TaxID=3364527 RepID=UPI00371786E7